MEKCLLHQALRPGDPLIKLLELRFVSSSSETSRSSGTIQTSQSSISSHPVFPDALAPSTWLWSSEPPPPYDPSPLLPSLTLVQWECSSTIPSSRSISWKLTLSQTQ